jgi:hypothetical protein
MKPRTETATAMNYVRTLSIAAGLMVAFAAIAADETAPVPRPDVKVGDSWRYRISIYQTNVPKILSIASRVSFVGPNVIVTVESGNDGGEFDSQYDGEWGVSSLGYLGQVFDPPIRFYKFPLQVGAEYPYVHGMVAQKGSPARVRAEGNVKVVGWEDVTVPAGKFRALKIEATGSFQRLDTSFRGWQRFRQWYVPEVKRAVKFTFESGTTSPAVLDLIRTTELVEFKGQ